MIHHLTQKGEFYSSLIMMFSTTSIPLRSMMLFCPFVTQILMESIWDSFTACHSNCRVLLWKGKFWPDSQWWTSCKAHHFIYLLSTFTAHVIKSHWRKIHSTPLVISGSIFPVKFIASFKTFFLFPIILQTLPQWDHAYNLSPSKSQPGQLMVKLKYKLKTCP